jgi:hypothetical protein
MSLFQVLTSCFLLYILALGVFYKVTSSSWALARAKRQSEGHDVCRQVPSHSPRLSQPCFIGIFLPYHKHGKVRISSRFSPVGLLLSFLRADSPF